MDKTERMRKFIIKFLYYAIWVAILYCLLKYALPLFMPFILAFFIAFLLKPLINWISKKSGLGRRAVAIIILTLFYLIIGTLLALLGTKLVVYLGNWFARLPDYYRNTIEPNLTAFSNSFDETIRMLDPTLLSFYEMANESISRAASNIVSSISSGAINLFGNVAGSVPWIIVGFVLTIIASYFLAVDYYRITAFIVRQLPPTMKERVFAIKDFVVNVLFRFARAYLILMSITFAEMSVGLLLLGAANPFIIALLTAIVDILPVFGTGAVLIPWALYALISGNYFLGIGLGVLYAVITVIRQIIEPRIVGRQIGLYPLLTLIAMFVGARLFGFWGLFGLPILLTVLIHLNKSGEISIYQN